MEYRIPEMNMEKLKEKLSKIERKCKKYGCEFSFTEKSVEYEEIESNGEKKTVAFVVVEISGKAVVNGWKFIATIDHTEKGNILRGYSDEEIPKRFYTAECFCEHCRTRRRRNNSFIVKNIETGEFKQVGKNCLLDYTNGLSAENVALYLSFFSEAEKSEEYDCYGYGFSSMPKYTLRDELLIFTAETVRCFGYEQGKTGGRAMDYADAYYNRMPSFMKEFEEQLKEEMLKAGFDIENKHSKKLVADALKWIEEQEETNNYIHNLKTACALDYVKPIHYNLLASLFPAYAKNLEYLKKKEAEKEVNKCSVYVGKIKDRLTLNIIECRVVTSYETQFGVTRIYRMVDENKNVFIWKTSNYIEEEKFTITGTVKDHKEFRDIKQTELTRCRVVETV